MCSIKITYKTSFSQSQGNKTLLTASQQTAHAQSVTFSLLRNSNLHKNLNRTLQLILLCFYCTVSPRNETPGCHLPEDIFCARSKALCGIQPRCSGASTAVAQQFLSRAPQPWCFHVKTLTWLAGVPGMAKAKAACSNAQCQLWYPWFRYSLDESYGCSQETEDNDDFKDLREAAVL